MSQQRFPTLGSKLRGARLDAGLSQGDLGAVSGIPKARISRYENDHVEPSIRSFLRLCLALGVRPAELLDPSG
jgi:transcriptional regulator with XRE-family HTH domain